MPTIVFSAPTKERLILLGVAEGTKAAVCDPEGNIRWVDTKTLTVLEVDDRAPVDLLAERRRTRGDGGSAELVDEIE